MGKKKCENCKREIDKKFVYCPYCGKRQKPADGLLDEIEDIMQEKTPSFGFSLFGNFHKIVENLAKQIESEFERIDKGYSEKDTVPKRGISIKIDLSSPQPKITMTDLSSKTTREIKPEAKAKPEVKEKKLEKKISKEKLAKLEKLPRTEAKSSVRRLSDRVVYEIDLEGVESMDDIEIRQMENTTEVKAIGKDKIYFKLIPIAFPILGYEFKNQKLYIYFKPEI
jgi:hypothetical protein